MPQCPLYLWPKYRRKRSSSCPVGAFFNKLESYSRGKKLEEGKKRPRRLLAEWPGTDETPVSSKQAQTSEFANKTLISLEFVNNLIMDIYNGHGNSAEDII